MKRSIGPYQAIASQDFAELALGTPPELWLGTDGETPEERAAREDAARDILSADPGMHVRLKLLAAEVRRLRASGQLGVAS